MNRRKEILIESFILLSLPLSVFAGCANTDIFEAASMEPASMVQPQREMPSKVATQFLHLLNKKTSYPLPSIHTGAKASLAMGQEPDADSAISRSDEDALNSLQVNAEAEAEFSVAVLPKQHIYYFPSNASNVNPQDYLALKQHADYLRNNPNLLLNIDGFSDQQGASEHNRWLSEKRADAVATLLGQFGVSKDQLLVTGRGEVSTADKSAKLDRRVELVYSNPIRLSTR